uniref:Putative mucin-like protein n=1 Tax=Aedes aegypti TaxID=7159 RepID=Q8T4Q9_AEDAE|nr:putative mucin-like protein [Aedes aegypti]
MKSNLFISFLLAVTISHCKVSTAPVGKCPDIFDSNHLVFLPHEDCTKFYLCGHNGPVEKQCPSGLHWNSQASVCDWPELAGCSGGSTVPPTVTVTPEPVTSTTASPAVTTMAPAATTSAPPSSTVAPTNKCPEFFNPDHVTFMPHADCSKFYVCTQEGPVEKSCPSGLHWNQQGSICDWPAVAGCVASASIPPKDRETVGQCPELYDPENEVFLADASDCSKYYLCTWGGIPVLLNCPAGLHWNKNTNQCDWPAQAGCAQFDRDLVFKHSKPIEI